MKILVISTCSINKNGVTNVIFNIIKAIGNEDLCFDIVAVNNPEQSYKDELENICQGRIIYLDRRMKNIFRYVIKLKQLIQAQKYDIVHVHGNSATLAIETIAATLAGCKVKIAHSHNTTCKSKIVDALLRPLFYCTYTHGLACGVDAGKWMFGKREFRVINNGIDTKKFQYSVSARNAIREELKISEDTILMGHVGVFNEQKNQSFLIEIFRIIQQQNNNYKLLLVGEGRLLSDVKKLVREYQLNESVIFTGGVSQVSDYLSACDMIVMPSLYEGLPLALIEEQANGLPCLISDTITKEVDKTGNVKFISLDKNAKQWAEIILETSIDSDREKRSEVAIRKIIECGYSIEHEARKLEKYYIELCKDN